VNKILLTVSGVIPPDIASQVAAGKRPKPDYMAMAEGFPADLIDYSTALQKSGRLGRLLRSMGGPNLVLAWTCFRLRQAYDVIFTDGEQVGIPYALLAKFSKLDAAALDAWSVCRMATLYGARAVGLGDQIGSLEAGKQADLIAVRTDTPRMTPLLGGRDGNLHHNLVHAVQGGDVDMTMVAGRIVVDGGVLLTADLHELIGRLNAAVPDLFRRRGEWLSAHRVVNELKHK
jgi:hypothetical protein